MKSDKHPITVLWCIKMDWDTSDMKTKILLVDDHKIMLDGLRPLLQKQDHVGAIENAETGWLAVEKAKTFQPDLVIMDNFPCLI